MQDKDKLAAIEQLLNDIPMTRRTLTVQKLIQQIHAILWDKSETIEEKARRLAYAEYKRVLNEAGNQ